MTKDQLLDEIVMYLSATGEEFVLMLRSEY